MNYFSLNKYSKTLGKSINKWPCENYLFKVYYLKAGIQRWILALRTLGSYFQKRGCELHLQRL